MNENDENQTVKNGELYFGESFLKKDLWKEAFLICISDQGGSMVGADINKTGTLLKQSANPIFFYHVNALGERDFSKLGKVEDTSAIVFRRSTPVESERLMGFPDNWTRIPWRGKPEEQCPDTPRYEACGNSMCVNVMRWIGMRIEMVEKKANRK